MRVTIRFPQAAYERLLKHLFQDNGLEWGAYIFVGPNGGPEHLTFCVREVWLVPRDAYVRQSAGGLEVKAAYVQGVLRHAYETGQSFFEAHSHPFSCDGVSFSGIDTGDESRKFPYVAGKIPHIWHGTLVFGRESVDAHLYNAAQRAVELIDRVNIVGAPLRGLIPTSTFRLGRGANNAAPAPLAPSELERYTRQVTAFGSAGQSALRDLTVGVGGAGSVGLLLAQLLAYLGVRRFVIADADVVELSNLNRLVGATPDDANARRLKVDVACRMIHAIAPEAAVEALPTTLLDPLAHQALKAVDVLFGATDNHGARLILNDRLAVQYLIPYIDVGTGLEANADGRLTHAGGWVRTVIPGQWCLQCIGVIDGEQATLDLLPATEREQARRHGYVSHADVPAPSVVFLNSTLASLAVGELMNLVTGFKPPHPLIWYDLFKQRSMPVAAEPRADCPACSAEALLGIGDLEAFPAYAQDSYVAPPVAG